MKKRRTTLPILIIVILGFLAGLTVYLFQSRYTSTPSNIKKQNPTPISSPTPTPTPKPLTFAEMNALYGPCVYLPTLMYHHVQDWSIAQEKKQTSLTVGVNYFGEQMQYLKDKGYNTVTISDLINFFDSGAAIPRKSVLITFDDGYEDFYLDALPILKQYGFKATVFTPTGLMDNPDYLTWQQVIDASNAGILFGNHTWSHRNVKATQDIMQKEISLADGQLTVRGLDNPKVFAYPYGIVGAPAENYLTSLGYSIAFTTQHGSTLCKKQRLSLPRIRIGNGSLSLYGL